MIDPDTLNPLENVMSSIEIAKLRRDGGTQPRAGIYTDTVEEYAEALETGATFPPVVVFYDGSDYWLADGFHRTMAHEKAGRSEIAVDVRQGTRRDAVLHSTGANAAHGLPRTREDKRRAVRTLVTDEEWASMPDREIARRTATHPSFVAKIKSELSVYIDRCDERTVTRNGVTYTMNTAAIGISPEEVERREKLAAERAAAAERILADQAIADAQAAAEKAKAALAQKDQIIKASSANEKRVMDERDAAQALAEKARTAMNEALTRLEEAREDKKRALADKDEAKQKAAELAEKAAEEAWVEADEKYETIVNRLTREAAEAKSAADAAKAEVETVKKEAEAWVQEEITAAKTSIAEKEAAVAKAIAEARATAIAEAKASADLLAAQAIEERKVELADLEAKKQAAKDASDRAYKAKERLESDLKLTQEMIRKHEEEIAQWQSGAAETETQIKLAVALSEAAGVAMSEIGMLEHAAQPAAIPKLRMASQRCRQIADAIDGFLGDEPVGGSFQTDEVLLEQLRKRMAERGFAVDVVPIKPGQMMLAG